MAPVAAQLQDGHVPLLNVGVRLCLVVLQVKGSNWQESTSTDTLCLQQHKNNRPSVAVFFECVHTHSKKKRGKFLPHHHQSFGRRGCCVSIADAHNILVCCVVRHTQIIFQHIAEFCLSVCVAVFPQQTHRRLRSQLLPLVVLTLCAAAVTQ